jgi:hypothetical protein
MEPERIPDYAPEGSRAIPLLPGPKLCCKDKPLILLLLYGFMI